jgi:glycosyltransferase involved in cell wall biosynthesis
MTKPRRLRRPYEAGRELVKLVATRGVGSARRWLESVTGRGEHGAPITTGPERTVLLFFEDVERDTFVRGDRHVRRAIRHAYHAATEGRRITGFEGAFRLLLRALESAGCRVVVNNARLARRFPDHPIGICGYPHILLNWDLPNPAVLGPGLFDHPAQAPTLINDPRFKTYLVPCEWMKELFEPYYGRCAIWFGGLDIPSIPDCRDQPKDVDFLVYEKILWNREATRAALVQPVLEELQRRGLTIRTLPYGGYSPAEYHALLARSRAMLYLCEHETQGLAYQEAMARNVPVLAWDQGWWLDPIRERYSSGPVRASSVPYFSPECGERFTGVEDFPRALDCFLQRRETFRPREYVANHLALEHSAERYLQAYQAAAGTPRPSRGG